MLGIYVNPSERPSQMIKKFESAGSEGGQKITSGEKARLHLLYQHWTRKNFQQLRTLQSHSLFREVRALKSIQELPGPRPTQDHSSPNALLNGSGVGVSAAILGGLVLAVTILGAGLCEHFQEKKLIRRQDSIIDQLNSQLQALELRWISGELTQASYELERAKTVREVVQKNLVSP